MITPGFRPIFRPAWAIINDSYGGSMIHRWDAKWCDRSGARFPGVVGIRCCWGSISSCRCALRRLFDCDLTQWIAAKSSVKSPAKKQAWSDGAGMNTHSPAILVKEPEFWSSPKWSKMAQGRVFDWNFCALWGEDGIVAVNLWGPYDFPERIRKSESVVASNLDPLRARPFDLASSGRTVYCSQPSLDVPPFASASQEAWFQPK